MVRKFINHPHLPTRAVAEFVIEESVAVTKIEEPHTQLLDTLLRGYLSWTQNPWDCFVLSRVRGRRFVSYRFSPAHQVKLLAGEPVKVFLDGRQQFFRAGSAPSPPLVP